MDFNKTSRFTFLILIVGFMAVASYMLATNRKPPIPKDGKLQVVTSFYPLYFFASEIAKDKANIINLTPAGSEPHDYEPNTQDIATVEQSKILIVNGAGFELWTDKIRDNLKNEDIKTVAAAENLATQKDPHVWLDPLLAKQEVAKIMDTFIDVDPNNKSFYEANSKDLAKRLDALDQNFRQGLASCSQKNFVTSHAAFGYIASRYGLTQIAITGLSPDQEPSPQELGEISTFAKKNNLKYIFFETLVSPRLAETIAKEIGAKTLVLDPIEGLTEEEQQKGSDYFSIQRKNLANLQTALECK